MANPNYVSLDYDSAFNVDAYLRRPSDGKVWQGGAGGDSAWHVWADGDVIKYAMAYTKYNDGYFVCPFPVVDENVEYDWIDKQRIGADPAVGDVKLGARHFNRKKVLDADGLVVVSTAEPTGAPNTWDFLERLNALFRAFFYKSDNNGSKITYYKDDDATPLAEQTVSDVAGTETIDKAAAP